MPSVYAHYRFGTAMLEAMPGDIRRTAKRFRRLFDVGLHGPDIFFYYNPLRRTALHDLGGRIHKQTGREFFSRVCRGLRLEPSQAAEAYLYGLLCHYVLDSACRHFVAEQAQNGEFSRIELETEFDRFLLEKDGKCPPETQDISPHICLEPRECTTVTRFYPGVTDRVVGASVRNMAIATKALAKGSQWLQKGVDIAGGKYRGAVMTKGPNPRCSALDAPLWELYCKAEERFPDLLMQLSAHLTYNASLEADFLNPFG